MNSSLKDYYVRIEELYNESVKLLLALNKSLTSNASEVNVQITNSNGTSSSIKIPSFLYIESKIEQLSTNFNTLFNIPKTGEAWFHQANDMYKLKLVQSNVAPIVPEFDVSELHAGIKQNNFLKDLVSPQTFLKLNISNIPDNIEEIFMKKYVFYDEETYNQLVNGIYESHDDYVAALYNLTKGVDYNEYESVLKMPIRKNDIDSEFKIVEIINRNSSTDSFNENVTYELKLDTIKYYNTDDKTIEYKLKINDYITLRGLYNIFKVIRIYPNNNNEFVVELEETNGHTFLQTTDENPEMIFEIYNPEYSKYHYVEIPVEENQYITIFLATIHNNIRSKFSSAINVDLGNIYVYDENGNVIIDQSTSNKMTYMSYYNKYCKNIGDILEGLTNTVYPQFSNFTPNELQELQDSAVVRSYVSNALNNDDLKVVRINDHIFDEKTSEKVISLNAQKLSIQSQVTTTQNNIDDIYNKLTTTNFNEDVSVTQNSLKEKLNAYYNERNTLNKQLISIVNEINVLKGSVKSLAASKYRIRGILNTDLIEEYISENINYKCKIIGIDVEYRYKSINSDTSNVISVNANIFSEWNKYSSIDKERKLIFDKTNNSYSIDYVNYDSTNNIINWKQIDIPIQAGEEVIIRLRYKYSIGQPFMNFYSPWSDEFTMQFPIEFTNDTDLTSILEVNNDDVINAKFMNTLMSNGYEEHVNNKIIDGSQQYYHMPENIYSGFNTPENKLISLKDKLLDISTAIESLKASYNQYNQKFKVYCEYDGNTIELFTNINNKITINLYGNFSESSFMKKSINLIFRNTGEIPVNLYTIFPGTNTTFISELKYSPITKCGPYKDVPMTIDGQDDISETLRQTCNQWIYFRNNDPYTMKRFYVRNDTQQLSYIKDNEQGMLHPLLTNSNKKTYNNNNFTYTDTKSNHVLFKYENLKLGDAFAYSAFLQSNSGYEGGFLIPNLLNNTQVLCDSKSDNIFKVIEVGNALNIPLLLEYYIQNNKSTFNITKKLCFDVRPNVDAEIQHYMLTVNVINNVLESQNSYNSEYTTNDTEK